VIELLSLSRVERALLMKKNKKENKTNNIAIKNDKKEKSIINLKLNQENKKKTVSCLILINNLNLLCSAYYTGQIVLWDIITKNPQKIFNDQKTIINQVIYNPITNRIYTCGFEHEIYIYDPYNGEKSIKKLGGHNASISSISFNKETNELVSIDISGIMKLWDTNNFYNFQSINIKEILNLEGNQQQKRNNRNNLLYFMEKII
jgi:WD40 repeat protein